MPDIVIERAGAEEAGAVAGLIHALLDELSGGKAPAPEALAEAAGRVFADGRVVPFLARSGGEPVGVMMLNECVAIYAGGVFGEISELYIRPDLRSHGVAARLIETALAEARARGWGRLEVGAPAQPKWARTRDFYLRNGFEEVGPRLRIML